MSCCPGFTRIFLALTLAASLFWTFAGPNASSRIEVRGETAREFQVQKGKTYALLASAPSPGAFANGQRILVNVTGPGATITKNLHAGDADLYTLIEATGNGTLRATLTPSGPGTRAEVEVTLRDIKGASSKSSQIGAGNRATWQQAQAIELGRPVYSTADERPYIPTNVDAKTNFGELTSGIHWYRFNHAGPGDKLVHFNIEILDRDVPVDVAVFTAANNTPAEYTRGRERYETEKSTNFHGLNKFAARVLSPGTYYVRVMGNHPWYKLETDVYPAPPYTDPKLAVRAAMDYIIRRGDSWHANVPRKGAVVRRDSNPLQETRLCIACHPTHFSTRAELFGIRNGYPVRARQSLQFLTERLANNPRPIYGHTDASWARMIHAPGNVLSRVAYLTDQYEQLVTGDRREELYRGVARFLEMYWPGVTEPQMESNGNLPRISGYEVALHNALLFADLHRRTGDAKYKVLRDQVETVIVTGKTVDMIDLCWKIDALVTLDKEKHKALIASLASELLSHQQPDGRWAMPFGLEETQYDFRTQSVVTKKIVAREKIERPRASDFQTWHAVYALARAGFTDADLRVRKAVDLCLSRQTPSGAWQGNPDYKNFDTPFRDTQYAVMALSTLYPNAPSPAKGWGAGPAKLDTSNLATLVGQLDQQWDRPASSTSARIRSLLQSEDVLVRFQAATAIGRYADTGAIDALAARLGDPSKLVQRASAWSLRQIATRRPEAREAAVRAIRNALDSPNERTRLGATRIFNQHFKYLSEDWTLGEKLLSLAGSDPVPAVKMGAVQALYQWWFWDRDTSHKSKIEDALIAGLNRDEHPLVRRNLIEAYYNTLDDNVRYLYGSWIPRIKRAEDKRAVETAHKEGVRIQAVRYRDAMKQANALGRDGLLRALYTHHIREGLPDVTAMAAVPAPPTVAGHWVNGYRFASMYDPLRGGDARFTSVGNDSEPPVFYPDSAPVMNEALLAALEDPSEVNVRGIVRALTFLKSLTIGAPLADRLLALVMEAPPAVRRDVADLAKAQLRTAPVKRERIEKLIREGDATAVEVVAAITASGRNAKELPLETVSARLLATNPQDRAFPALASLASSVDELRRDERLAAHVMKGLDINRPQPQQAAVKLVLADPSVLRMPAVQKAWDGFPGNRGPYAVGGSLNVIGQMDYSRDGSKDAIPEVRRLLIAGLDHPVHTIRSQALTTLRSIEPLHRDAGILRRVETLLRDPEQAVRASAASFQSSQMAKSGNKEIKAGDVADYFYFKENVEPILIAKGSDGHACANCHANHTVLKLIEPDEFGVVTLEKSRQNYNAALAMINVSDPEQSLLLNKPVAPLDDLGTAASQKLSHGGGIRWNARQGSAEYRTILRWIQGARLDASSEAGGGGK